MILASGLDARAWRLTWPQDATVYELDQPGVLDFKDSTLREHGASPAVTRVNVPIDLREDWPAALRSAGFDPAAPTAWSAEGLLPYLPASAQDLLFERIQELSGPGSRIAVEAFGSDFLDPDKLARQRAQMEKYREAAVARDMGEMPDIGDLVYLEDHRADVPEWLSTHGWTVAVVGASELLALNHRTPPDDLDGDATPSSQFVTGHYR